MRIEPTADYAKIQALAQAIWREYYPAILRSEQIEYMLEQMYSQETLAKDAKRGVHFALIEDRGFIGCEMQGPVCKLHKLYVDKSARGKGVGQAALDYVIDWARKNGATTVRLNVNKHNVLAQKAYERRGFVRAASEVIDIGKGYVMDDFIYELAVTS